MQIFNCGFASRAVHASLLLACLALVPSAVSAQTTALFLESQPGDPVGGGISRELRAPAASFNVSPGSTVTVSVFSPATSFYSFLRFRGPDARLGTGVYDNAFDSASAAIGLRVDTSTPCVRPAGRFVVLEAEYAPSGTLVRFAVDFEQHCDGLTPALFGALRFNSTISSLTPFSGDYPRFRLSVATPAHGIIVGGGLNCGLGGTQCSTDFGTVTTATLTATPEPGYVFLGWTGACIGGRTVSVVVNGPHSCGAVFDRIGSGARRTFLRLVGETGSLGEGIDEYVPAAASQWEASNFGPSGIFLRTIRQDGAVVQVQFAAVGGGLPLPDTYEAATSTTAFGRPLQVVSVHGRSCPGGGRFVVHELTLDGIGNITSFSADFEQHCDSSPGGVFGAIRLNAMTVDSVEPFEGDYPAYRLTVRPALHGRVTGNGLDCPGGTTCVVSMASAEALALTATPDAGYVFAGWTGACSGGPAATTVAVKGPTVCAVAFEPLVPATARMLLVLNSETGDTVGGGQRRVFSAASAAFTLSSFSRNALALTVRGSDGSTWLLRFGAPGGEWLAPGVYLDAEGSFGVARPKLEVNCSNRPTGRFVVRDLVVTNGTLTRFAADFEQHCSDNQAALFGLIRYNSAAAGVEPYGGASPEYRLTVAADGGRVSGGGLDCSSATGTCTRTFTAAEHVTLTAFPDAGRTFAGWSGSCFGAETTTVNVNGPKMCRAHFRAAESGIERSLFVADSQPGDDLGNGIRTYLPPGTGRWTVLIALRNHVRLQVSGPGGTEWQFELKAPDGAAGLIPGVYDEARRSDVSGPAPGIAVSRGSHNCTNPEGRFVIYQFALATTSAPLRLAADFEVHCRGQVPATFGAVRFNARLGTDQPFGGSYPPYRLSVATPDHGRIHSDVLNCGAAGTACTITLATAGALALTATPDVGYVFAGWSGACAGRGVQASVLVYGDRQCRAMFLPAATAGAATMLSVERSPGVTSALLSGTYNVMNASWDSALQVNDISMEIDGADTRTWRLVFSPAPGATLAPGVYRFANFEPYPGSTPGPGMVIWSPSLCTSANYGYFVVHDLAIANGKVQRFAVDFELRCGSATTPPLSGMLRYNTAVTPGRRAWGSHLMITGAGPGGGPHVQGVGVAGSADTAYNFFAYDPSYAGGVSTAYGDVDGDGTADIVTAPGPGTSPLVRILTATSASPSSARQLREIASLMAYSPAFTGGVNVAVGDVTGDGIAEIITAPGPGDDSRVHIYQVRTDDVSAGAYAVEYASFTPYEFSTPGGVRVAVGDVDGDGAGEVLTVPGPGGTPLIRAFRTPAGANLATPVLAFYAYAAEYAGGVFVAAGDVDGDGRDDIITGTDAGSAPEVRVFAPGATLGSVGQTAGFLAFAPSFAGGVRVGAADLDADGRAEILTGAGPGGNATVGALRRLPDGSFATVTAFTAYAPPFGGGVFVSGMTR